ncbi:M48 family metallopeptidase [Phenylobacterium aquaticum]|uniref:M48 family metallopeptidase n=1 Tax=Phenylobacterium aquaticum TaxID=1763816 RepID=UPI0026F30E65|nr:M48 family metallopeptidase [Phenylobacterium aquaticum]
MAQFDPVAATAAYLAVLTPAQHAKAQAYTQGGHWLLLWGAIVAVLASWLVLRSGVLVKVRDGVEKGSPKPIRVAFAVLFIDAIAEFVLNLPWSVYADWWRETAYGLTSQAFGGWLGEQLMSAAISAVLFTLLLVGLYTLMRKAPKTWWLWGSGVVALFFVVVMILAPVFIMPLFNKYQPAPPGPVRDEIVAMAKSVGVPSDKIFIFDGSKQSNRYTANVAGLGSTSRIAMSDVMFKKDADIAEVRGVVGHEMGHYVHAHVFIFAALYAALALAGFFIIDRAYAPVARMLGAKHVRGLSDPAGFPILAILLTVLGLVSTPIRVSITRIAESDADTFSLEHFNEPDGLAKALVKTIEYRAATPSKLEEVLFYDHPSVGGRVRKAMDWKAAQAKVDAVR